MLDVETCLAHIPLFPVRQLVTLVSRVLSVYLAAMAILLSGCATLPAEGPRSYSTSIPASGPASQLDLISRSSLEGATAGQSGFRLVLGPAGLDARLLLIRGAQRSLDLQYYHLHDDATGRLVLRELRDAARRGVRVRLLLDDLYTQPLATLLNGIGAYANVEVRLFNPFPTRGTVPQRFLASFFDFRRLNHRMHNKLFIADGVLAIAGGRNIGDEYFMRGTQSNFFDYDVLAAGPVVPQMSSLFDEYWNTEHVRTAFSVLRPSDSPEASQKVFDTLLSEPDSQPNPIKGKDRLGHGPIADELLNGRVYMTYGIAQAFADSPAKARGDLETGRLPSGALLDSSRLLLAAEFDRAQHEIWISSPYLVPGEQALIATREKTRRGVRMKLLTNALAATDEPVVHTGYRRYRDNLLRSGVQIFELHPSLGQKLLLPGEIAHTSLRLHTKAAVIDAQTTFLGSVNLDPRSDRINTEFGLLIQSPELAKQALALFKLISENASYEVRLKAETGRDLEWVLRDGDATQVFDSEPGADLWTRMRLYIQSILIPESLL